MEPDDDPLQAAQDARTGPTGRFTRNSELTGDAWIREGAGAVAGSG